MQEHVLARSERVAVVATPTMNRLAPRSFLLGVDFRQRRVHIPSHGIFSTIFLAETVSNLHED
jgi:hypothetical protein